MTLNYLQKIRELQFGGAMCAIASMGCYALNVVYPFAGLVACYVLMYFLLNTISHSFNEAMYKKSKRLWMIAFITPYPLALGISFYHGSPIEDKTLGIYAVYTCAIILFALQISRSIARKRQAI